MSTTPVTPCTVSLALSCRDQLVQATVNLRVLDANTFLRDSLIGSYQFNLLGIYVEKVFMTPVSRATTLGRHNVSPSGIIEQPSRACAISHFRPCL